MEHVLKIPYDLTIALQNQNCTMSDFFGHWLRCELRLKNCSSVTNLPMDLLNALEERKTALFSNSALICAVFLDPRFRSQLSDDQIKVAKETVIDTLDKIVKLQEESADGSVTDLSVNNDTEDILEKHLRTTHNSSERNTEEPQMILENSLKEIDELNKEKRLPTNYSVLKFWQENKEKYPLLFQVAEVMHAIPPTQVPVERSFSVLGLVYNSRRVQLKQEMLENIIHIKLNKDLAYQIFEKDINEIEIISE